MCQRHYNRLKSTGSVHVMGKHKNCETCGTEMALSGASSKTQRFCSRKCRSVVTRSRLSEDQKSRIRSHQYKWKLKQYGITPDDYDRMYSECNGKCSICDAHQTELGTILVIDHDHSSGMVRGLLCRKCNASLGGFGDSEDLLTSAISYLRKHRLSRVA